jgi:hypothetical protein
MPRSSGLNRCWLFAVLALTLIIGSEARSKKPGHGRPAAVRFQPLILVFFDVGSVNFCDDGLHLTSTQPQDQDMRLKRIDCERTACQGTKGEARATCTYKCISPQCFDEVYAHDPVRLKIVLQIAEHVSKTLTIREEKNVKGCVCFHQCVDQCADFFASRKRKVSCLLCLSVVCVCVCVCVCGIEHTIRLFSWTHIAPSRK